MKLLLLFLAWFRPRATDLFKVNSLYLRGGNIDAHNDIKEIKEDFSTIYKPLNENVGQFISYKDGSYHYETVDSVKEKFFQKN